MTKELKKKIATGARKHLFNECFKRIYALNISLKQSYNGVLSDVRTDFPEFEPYKNYESFKQSYYKRRE